ncbi:MAG: hypothetical protein A3G81_17805 [Betaproteobacteria bacterium RIFCSPLOWO2_12_FULL_65_14]|nr:MAG: hypothetical protein A3G81_17805 [Betaproteobacteria bacterium RIFCSPLOWO2_12_FULL_65_14]
MSARSGKRSSQRGAAMLVMLAIIAIGGSWLIVSRLNSLSANVIVAKRNHNAAVLNKAKQALIGYVAVTAAQAGENNPGRLPCPEAAGYVGTSSEGTVAGSCTLPKVGRLPWRTLGLDKLVDADSEPLWYVVSPGWAYTSSNLTIHSNTAGQLTVDGAGNDSVALIIAPGAAMNVQASAGCSARNQARAAPSPSINALDYIECFDPTTPGTFATTGPGTSFNDQVVRITTADVMPAIEAAIAHRIEREIVPVLRSVYGTAQWSLSSTNPLFPYAVPFTDPESAGYPNLGTAGTTQGLLPFTAQSSAMRWNSSFSPTVTVVSGAAVVSGPANCNITDGRRRARCRPDLNVTVGGGPITLRMTARTEQNVALGLQQLDSSVVSFRYKSPVGSWTSVAASASGEFNSDGTANIFSEGTFVSGAVGLYDIDIDTYSNEVFVGHPLLDANAATTGWFVRNQWYRLIYYATTAGHTAANVPAPSCTSGVNCLSVANVTPANQQRAILVLAGRSVPGQTRPNGTLSNYLEFGNAAGAFERQPVSTVIDAALKKPFNDRVVVIDANP